MTGNTDKLRGLVLAALMVISVVGGTIAFAGTAAAVPTTTTVTDQSSVSPTSVDVDTTETYTFTVNGSVAASTSNDQHVVTVHVPSGFSSPASLSATGNASVSSVDSSSIVDLDGDGTDDALNVTFTNASVTNNPTHSAFGLSVTADLDSPSSETSSDVEVSVDAQTGSSTDYQVENSQIGSISVDDTGPVPGEVVQYHDGSNWIIEVPYDEDLAGATGSTSSVELYSGSEDVTSDYVTGVSEVGGNGALEITLSQEVTDSLEVNITAAVTDAAGNPEAAGNQSVVRTPTSIDVSGSNSDTVYRGTKVAFYDDGNQNFDFDITTDDEFVFEGSTGTNSQVYVFDTVNRNVSATFYFDNHDVSSDEADGSGQGTLDLRNLGLSASAPEDGLDLKTDDDLEVDVSANAGNRPITAELFYANNDTSADSMTHDLDGSGEWTFNFGTQGESDYYVEVTDVDSGITETVEDYSVTGYADAEAAFASTQYMDERGDVMNITVEITGASDEAQLYIGQADVNYQVAVTVTDGNDDGEVVLSFNTYEPGSSSAFSTPYAPDDEDDDEVSVDKWVYGQNLGKPLAATGYDLNITAVGSGEVEQDVASISLSPRSTTGISTWVAPDKSSLNTVEKISDKATQLEETAFGDEVVFQIEASGLEGFVSPSSYDAADLNGTTHATEGVYLEIAQTSTTVNEEATHINITDANLVKDLNNNQFFVVFDSGSGNWEEGEDYEATLVMNESSPYVEDTTNSVDKVEFTSDISLVERETTFDGLNETDYLNLAAEDGVEVSGDSTAAPGTNISVTLRSTGNFILKNPEITVQEDGTWSTSFDLGEYEPGTAYTVSSPDATTRDGVLQEAAPETTTTTTTTPTTTTTTTTSTTTTTTSTTTTTTTTTEETTTTTTATPTTETTTTTTPGFGIGVALIALLGAALLALRRKD